MSAAVVKAYRQAYVLSNEYQSPETMREFEQFSHDENACVHVGVSGWQNYDMALMRKNTHMVLLDYNPVENELHEITGRVILEAKDVQDFVNKILVAFEKSDLDLRDYVHDAKSVEEIPYWLQSQDRFEAVQKMFKEEKVIIAYMNLAEPEMVSKLRGLLQTWHLSLANIDAFYVSNVADWVPPPADVYRHNLEQVFAANHHMIAVYSLRSQNYQNSKVGLVRRVTRECPVSLTETCGIYMEYRKMDIFLKNKASAL